MKKTGLILAVDFVLENYPFLSCQVVDISGIMPLSKHKEVVISLSHL